MEDLKQGSSNTSDLTVLEDPSCSRVDDEPGGSKSGDQDITRSVVTGVNLAF